MAPIPEHELAAVNGMDGYEQLLEIDRLCKVHGVDEATLRAAMASASSTAASRLMGFYDRRAPHLAAHLTQGEAILC